MAFLKRILSSVMLYAKIVTQDVQWAFLKVSLLATFWIVDDGERPSVEKNLVVRLKILPLTHLQAGKVAPDFCLQTWGINLHTVYPFPLTPTYSLLYGTLSETLFCFLGLPVLQRLQLLEWQVALSWCKQRILLVWPSVFSPCCLFFCLPFPFSSTRSHSPIGSPTVIPLLRAGLPAQLNLSEFYWLNMFGYQLATVSIIQKLLETALTLWWPRRISFSYTRAVSNIWIPRACQQRSVGGAGRVPPSVPPDPCFPGTWKSQWKNVSPHRRSFPFFFTN